MIEEKMHDDTISRTEAIIIASGYCHPANIADELRKLPSAQPERKKGNWILIAGSYTDYVKCDQCGNISYIERNFCPSCGADMRGEQE